MEPEACIFVEGRWVDVNKMIKLFEDDKTRLLLKMTTFKVESTTFIEGQLATEVFKRHSRYIQI